MSDSVLNILINAKDQASSVLSKIGSTIDNVKGQAQSLASSGLNQMNKGFEATAKVIKTAAIVGVIALTAALGVFATNTIQAASDYQKSMMVLDIVSEKFGINGKAAGELATKLGKDLRIGANTASDSLQYLIKSGLTLEQSADMMKRFTNEAVTGKSSSIDLATAVKNLAFAYTTGNSAIGNLSGVSENFNEIDKKGLAIMQAKGQFLGLTIKQLDSAQQMQARYAGMIDLTNLTMGSSERLQGTFGDNMLAIKARFSELQVELGTRFLPILGVVSDGFLKLIENINITAVIDQIITAFSNLIAYLQPILGFLIQNPLILQAVLIGLAGVVGVLFVGSLLKMAATALLAASPFIVLGMIIALLFVAWQTNFLGIRDITQNVLQYVGNVFQAFGTFLLQNLDGLTQGVFDFANSAIGAFNQFISFLSTTVGPIFGDIVAAIADIAQTLTPVVGSIIAEIIYIIGDFIQWLLPFIMPVLKQMVVTFGQVFKSVMLIVTGATKFIQGIFTGDWRKMLEGLIDMVSGLVGGIAAIMDGIINVVRLGIAKVVEMISSIGENEWVAKGLDILGLGNAMSDLKKVKAELEKPLTTNQDDAKSIAAKAKGFLGIDVKASDKENANANNAVDGIISTILAGMDGMANAIAKTDFKAVAQNIRNVYTESSKLQNAALEEAKNQINNLSKNAPQVQLLGENEKGAIKSLIQTIGQKAGDFGKGMSETKTGAVEMPNLMEGTLSMLASAKSALDQAELAQKAKDQADAQKSILDGQKKAVDATTSGGDKKEKGKKEKTQAQKDLDELKAQLEIMKSQASTDIEALQRQKESLQYEEAKTKLTEASITMNTAKSDALEQQLKSLEAQKLTLSQLDPLDKAGKLQKDDQLEAMQRMLVAKRDELELAKQSEQTSYKESQNTREKSQKERDLAELELSRQIQLRKDKLGSDSKPLEQKIANITINVQTLPGQSNDDIAQKVSQILAQQYNTA